MKSKNKIFTCGTIALFLLLISVFFANFNANGDTIQTSGNLELSTPKNRMGIKRGENILQIM